MTVVVDAPNKAATLTFDATEWAVLQRDPAALRNMIVTWLRDQAASWFADDKRLVLHKLENATQAEINAAKTALGL